MTPTERRAAWIDRQLKSAPPLTQDQQAVLRRILLPRPIRRSA